MTKKYYKLVLAIANNISVRGSFNIEGNFSGYHNVRGRHLGHMNLRI